MPASSSASPDQQQLSSRGRASAGSQGTASGVGELWFPQGPLLLPSSATSNDSTVALAMESNAAAAAAAMDGGSFLTAGVPKTARLLVPGAANQSAAVAASPRPDSVSLLQQRGLRSPSRLQADAAMGDRGGKRSRHHHSKHHQARHLGKTGQHRHQVDTSEAGTGNHRRVLGEAVGTNGGSRRAFFATAQATLHPLPHLGALPSSETEQKAVARPENDVAEHSRQAASAQGDDSIKESAGEAGWVLLGGLAALVAAACNAVRWIGVQRLLEEVQRRAASSESGAEPAPSELVGGADEAGETGVERVPAAMPASSRSDALVEEDWAEADDDDDAADSGGDPGSASHTRSPSSQHSPTTLKQARASDIVARAVQSGIDAAPSDASVLLSAAPVRARDEFDLADESDGAALVIGPPEPVTPSPSQRQQASRAPPLPALSARAPASRPRAKLSPLFVMAWASPLSAALTAIVAVPAEGQVALSSPVWSSFASALGVLAGTALGAVLAFVMIGSELQVISRASAVSMTLAGHIKEALVILMGAVVLGEAIGAVEGAGIAMVVLGTAAFGLLESNKH